MTTWRRAAAGVAAASLMAGMVGILPSVASANTRSGGTGGSGTPSLHQVRAAEPAASRPSFRDGYVIAAFRPGEGAAAERRALAAVGARVVREMGDGALLLSVPARHVPAVTAALGSDRDVRYAEPDYQSELAAAPNDPSFPLQWAFQNTGQSVGGTTGTPAADENAVSAWNVTTGSHSIVIGEVDTGVDYTHPDLAANVWSNPGGLNGCSAGTHGYNVLTSACDPMDDDTQYGGHGTHVAGILGAVGNNGVGVTGVNWSTTILPVKWVNSSGTGYTSDLISALDWLLKAKQAGVNIRVVNDSDVFYGTAYSQALSDEIKLLGQSGILFVTAAGNTSDNNDNPSVRRYPCAYNLSNEICAGGTDQNDAMASWSNYGPTTVDLAAPGNNIYSTLRNGSYGYISGTSMASPQVAGAAALILSVDPGLTPVQLKARILEGTDPLPGLAGVVRSGGRLDICRAVPGCGTAPALTRPYSITPPPVTVSSGGPAPQAGTAISAGPGDWDLSPSTYAYQWQRCSSTGVSCAPIAGATSSTYVPVAADVGGTLQAVVTAANTAGSTGAASVPTLVVQAAPPTTAATFGKTNVGLSQDQATADYERLDSFALSQPGSVSKLTIYLARAASGSQVMKGVLYSDSGGTPGSLVAVSNELTFTSSDASGWYDMTFPSAVPLQSGTYWIGLQAGATSNVTALAYDDAAANSGAVASAPYANGPLSPFGTARLQTEQISIYATYTPASTGGTGGSGGTGGTGGTGGGTPSGGTVGVTTVGPNSDTMSANRKRVNSVQMTSAGHLTSISMYLQPTGATGSQSIEGVLYADSGGHPGALVAKTAAITYSGSKAAGWYTLTFSKPVAVSAATYWIGILSGGTGGVSGFRWSSVPGSRDYNVNTYSKGPSNPFGTSTVDSEQMSLYAIYTS